MSEPSPLSQQQQQVATLAECLRELTQVVRTTHRLAPATQQALADLVDELTRMLPTSSFTAKSLTLVVQKANNLAQALQQQHEDETFLSAAQEHWHEATLRAAAEAPLAAGIARQVVDTLANLGL